MTVSREGPVNLIQFIIIFPRLNEARKHSYVVCEHILLYVTSGDICDICDKRSARHCGHGNGIT